MVGQFERGTVGHVRLSTLGVLLLGLGCSSDKPAEKAPVEATPPIQAAGDARPSKVEEAVEKIVATCARATGEVEVRRKGEAHWTSVQIGATFRAGDWIRTNANSTARVQFLTSGALDLEQETTVIVDLAAVEHKAGEEAPPMVAVASGVAHGVMNRSDPQARPLLISKDGELVRLEAHSDEASYRISTSDEGTEIAVTDGDLSIVAGDTTQALHAGERADFRRGGLSPVTRMIGFPLSLSPGVDARFLFEESMSISLSWKKVKKAASYRLQVARDLSFESIIVDTDIAGTSGEFSPPEYGVYAWRVAAKDAKGRYGEHGFTRRIFAEKAQPRELLLAPTSGTKLAYDAVLPSVSFSWQSAGASDSYRLVVGKGSNPLANVAFDTTITTQVYVADQLPAGEYTWGVYVGESSDTPIFLKPWRLTIQQRKAPKANADGIWD